MMKYSPKRYQNKSWYLIHCQPRKEAYAAYVLQTVLGLNVFLPEGKIIAQRQIKNIPFFPGYLFVQADLQQTAPSRINTSPGVVRLVEFAGEPQSVPARIVEDIAERLQHMEVLNTRSFKAGDAVHMKKGGGLQELEMIFIGPVTPNHRVNVLLNFLGRMKEVQVDIEDLEKRPFQPQQR